MLNLWTLGGLSLGELLRRTAKESWQDAVFGQGSRMAFYHFLAFFPSLLLFFTATSGFPHLTGHLKHILHVWSTEVLPGQASDLLKQMMDEVDQRSLSGMQLASSIGGALWASLNGTWAMIYGLNRAYEVEERRSSIKLAITIVMLTVALAVSGSAAALLVFVSSLLEFRFQPAAIGLRIVEWVVLIALLLVSFSVLYRFAPNLRDPQWRWSTPGALLAALLWIGCTFGARLYFDHVNNYSRIYGHLNSVVMLLMCLYITNGAILIGGEMNSEIEKASAGQDKIADRNLQTQNRSGS
jgi:membrane protein